MPFKMKQKHISYKGASLSYKIFGEGSSVFLIHGFGEDGRIWDLQTGYLSKEFKVIVPDIPGSGNSTSLHVNNISLTDYADCIKAIATEEQITDFVIIGHSMGGYISLAYLEKYPDDLKGIGLFHSTALPDSEEKIEIRKKAIRFIESNGSIAFLKTSIPALFYKQEENKKYIDLLIENAEKFSKEQLIQYYEAMMKRPDRTSFLSNSKIPVLIIAGAHDTAISKESILSQTTMPNLCHFYMLYLSGHMGMLEESQKSCLVLDEFLHSFNWPKIYNRN